MSDVLSSAPSLASPLIFGMEIGTPLFAIAIAQAVTYYRTYPNDSAINKVYIGVLLPRGDDRTCIVRLVSPGSSKGTYAMEFAERMAVVFGIVGVFSQCHPPYIHVPQVSRHNKILCVFIVSASVIQCGALHPPFLMTCLLKPCGGGSVSGMAMNVVLLTDTSVHSMHSTAGETLGGIQLATSLLCDILNTGSLVYFLRQGRSSSFRSTRNVIDTLVLYSINIGLVTSILAIITLFIWFTMPQNFIFSTFHIIISKFYINSLLVSLNARRSMRQSTEVDTEGYTLRTIQEMVFS
ncbi:hypothetical protein PLEOSDRAFT_1109137 [Pleurotus ostreatus PC15]|uniref:DUF6534 domain-containing protein n=1 Tax=Pleurotus ostreatus (strain PC15) TaxID=1137138 RepID=A0A067N949_PLEO1|nr:hypothetical protein PLEOSDRAFT_1109137 [Pleurotus ostreatus PC15]